MRAVGWSLRALWTIARVVLVIAAV
ncbi:MAG: hypothetical protein JWN72_700, partial [Thermoleophilia bacterium]|nr:hypothetical protein [Thermoleophilia bacterium]